MFLALTLLGCPSAPSTPATSPSSDTSTVPTSPAPTSPPRDTADTATAPPAPASFAAELVDGALTLRSNVPRLVVDCVPGAWACDDVDADGLTDAWEDGLLDRLRPSLRFDESEPLLDDATAVLAYVARVAPVGERVRAFVMVGYSVDYGRCGLSGHNGDSERVALDLQPLAEGPGDAVLVGAYTAAHEGTVNDHGRVFVGDDLALLAFPGDPADGQPRWRVWPSDGKHATYGTLDDCEVFGLPCLEEDCEADGVADPAPYTRLPPIVNAGEPDHPRLTSLGAVGFPGDDAWADQDFCGGLGGLLCSSPVVEKLTVDPFAP
ncbi:MAG: hypothetical protein R3F59_09035 [Myxococcota bacterium]